jgi:dephospho-CoA kinase
VVKPSVPSGVLRIIVGGGIGAGKGVVSRILSDRDIAVISADDVGHAVLEPGGAAFADVASRWPSVVVDGLIDRSRLAAIVFADSGELERLEALTHAAITESIAEQVRGTVGPVAVEVPVLLPLDDGLRGGWRRVFVDADEQLRIERAVARGGNEDDVRRRVAAQVDRETWLDWADDVIENNGTVEALEEQVHNLIDDLVTSTK